MIKLFLSLLTTLLLLGGCSSKQTHAINIYTLKYNAQGVTPAIMIADQTLKVAVPQSTSEIKKNKILYAKNPLQRESYAYSRWSDTPNQMLAQYLVSALDQSGIFRAVISENSPARAEWLLQSTLEDFYQEFDANNQAYAVVKMRFVLIDNQDKKVIATHYISAKVLSDSQDAKGGVNAFDQALTQIFSDLKSWLITLL